MYKDLHSSIDACVTRRHNKNKDKISNINTKASKDQGCGYWQGF